MEAGGQAIMLVQGSGQGLRLGELDAGGVEVGGIGMGCQVGLHLEDFEPPLGGRRGGGLLQVAVEGRARRDGRRVRPLGPITAGRIPVAVRFPGGVEARRE